MFSSPQLFKEIHSQAVSPCRNADVRLQIIELQLKESLERETNLKKLNE